MNAAPSRLQLLAESLACMIEEDLALLADITPSTAEAWRKHRKGPAFIRIGNRVLYPIKGVADYLSTLTRAVNFPAKDLL